MKYHAPYGSTDPDASYVDKDVPGAVRGSAVPAAAIEAPQREIVNLITKSGLVPADGFQLASAVQTGKVNYAVAGGTANALTATLSPVPVALTAGMRVTVKIATTNTGAATLDVNGFGAKPVRTMTGCNLQAGDLPVGALMQFAWSGDAWIVSPAGLKALNAQVITNSQTFIVPEGVLWIFVRLWAAGGGGGGSGASGSESAGAGGAGGGYCEGWFSVTPGQSIPITVGAGGTGGVAGSGGNGTNGGSSSVGSLCTAVSGSFGVGVTSGITAAAGVGGSASGGQLNINGSRGQGSSLIGSSVVGGMGGGSFSSGPSHFVTGVNGNGYRGSYPGGGGGGGAKGGTGGMGADGLCIISY